MYRHLIHVKTYYLFNKVDQCNCFSIVYKNESGFYQDLEGWGEAGGGKRIEY